MKYHMIEGEVEFILKAKPYPLGFVNQIRAYLDCVLNTAIKPTHESTGWGPLNIIPPLPKIADYTEETRETGLVFSRASRTPLWVDEFDPAVKIGEQVIVYQSVRIIPYANNLEPK